MPASLLEPAATIELARACGLDLGAYREEHVAERIRRALKEEGLAGVAELAALLSSAPEPRARFRRSVAMVVTGLFRDSRQFELLERRLLPELLGAGRRLRVWSAGCADGSELYSVAIVLARMGALAGASLLGSDLLDENLLVAARGVYGDVRLPATLTARMRWERRDLLAEPAPAGRWSLILCRNVAIYLRPEAKLLLHRRLADALAPRGVLLLGRSEQVSDPAALGLEQCAPRAYRRIA